MIKLDRIRPLPESTTKRRQIVQHLRNQILSSRMPAGEAVPTTHELADRFKVSYNTMHSALNDLVRDGLLVRHRGKGTFVGEGIDKDHRPLVSRLVLAVPPNESIRQSPYAETILSFLRGCSDGALACGADLVLISLPDALPEEELDATAQRIRRCDGLVTISLQYAPLVRRLDPAKFPCVTLDRTDSGEKLGMESASNITYDRSATVRMAVEHMAGHGHRRIGFFGSKDAGFTIKFQFFCEALAQLGLPRFEDCFEHCDDIEETHEAAKRLLSRITLPTAVYVDNEQKAQTLIHLARDRGMRIPEDLAVISSGTDVRSESFLSMVAVPCQGMGREAALLLDRVIRGAVLPPIKKVLPPQIAFRRSCGCEPSRKAQQN